MGRWGEEEGSWELGVGGWGRRGWGDGDKLQTQHPVETQHFLHSLPTQHSALYTQHLEKHSALSTQHLEKHSALSTQH
uniref:Uncharacterized protein n=1 Tax=Desertifilum tharense IPPAS B-1220 TaxID=1781255 RepID=A0ACD5H0U2_9CYAN